MARPKWHSYAAGSEVEHFAKFCREHLIQSEDLAVAARNRPEPAAASDIENPPTTTLAAALANAQAQVDKSK